MTTYLIGVREVHVSTMKVEAETEDDAIEMIRDAAGEEVMCEYSHTLDSSTWSVEKVG